MSLVQYATDSQGLALAAEPPQARPDLAERNKKRVVVSFGGTVVFGLALAGWYVGDRIYAADATHPVNVSAPMTAAPPPAAFVIRVPAPQAELYLETASLGDKQDLRFLKQLGNKGYAAKIDHSSILIGPFTDHESLDRASRKLAAAGILAEESSRLEVNAR